MIFRPTILLITFILLNYSSISQNNFKDSLKKIILHESNPRIRIDAINELADSLCLHKSDTGRILVEQALEASRKLNYHKGLGAAFHNIGLLNFRRNNDTALCYFYLSVNEYEKEKPAFEKMAFAINNISRTYAEMLRYDSSLLYAQKAVYFASGYSKNILIRNKWLMYGYGAKANAFMGKNANDSANIYFHKAILIAEQLQSNKMLEVYFKGLSSIQAELGNYNKAIEYGHKAIGFIENDDRALSISLALLGTTYTKVKDCKNAVRMADSSISVGKRANVYNSIGRNYNTKGTCCLLNHQFENALNYFISGLDLARKYKNSKSTISNLLRKTGDAYEALDSFQKAKEYYQASLETGEGDVEYNSNTYLQLSKLAYKEKKYEEAYQFLKKYYEFRDSTYTNERLRTIAELNTKYETDKKDQQLLLFYKDKKIQQEILARQYEQIEKDKAVKRQHELALMNFELENEKKEQLLNLQDLEIENNLIKQKDQQASLLNTAAQLKIERQQKALSISQVKNQRNLMLFIITGFIVLSLIGFLLFNRFRLMRKLQYQQSLAAHRQRISRDLHDEIGATLSGIAMYSHLSKDQLKNDQILQAKNSLSIIQDSASEMVNKLNDIVWLTNPEQDEMKKLLQRLEEYAFQMTAVKNIQLNSDFSLLHKGFSLNSETRRNIYLIFKEAINNAVKYSNAGIITLHAGITNDSIVLSISDNGKGFKTDTLKQGNGLKNIYSRAAELNASCIISSKPGNGTIIELSMKLPQ